MCVCMYVCIYQSLKDRFIPCDTDRYSSHYNLYMHFHCGRCSTQQIAARPQPPTCSGKVHIEFSVPQNCIAARRVEWKGVLRGESFLL